MFGVERSRVRFAAGAIMALCLGAFSLSLRAQGADAAPVIVQQPTNQIIVAASVNYSAELEVAQGWPLILEIGLLHPEMFDANAVPILICSTNGPWSNAVAVETLNAQQQIQIWPLQASPMTNETLLLTGETRGRLLWWLSPEQTAPLAEGTYELTVTLQTTNVTKPFAWNGVIKSVPVLVTITHPPAVITEEIAEQKSRLFARYAVLQGDEPQARREVAALLTAYPTNIGGLIMSMYLQRDAGQWVEALQTTEQALDRIYARSPLATEPPVELLQNQAELQILLAPPTLAFTLAAGQLTLRWEGRPGTRYKLETSDSLTAWAVRATNFTVTGNTYRWTTNVTGPQHFFRVTF
jgi:hypothetical protein